MSDLRNDVNKTRKLALYADMELRSSYLVLSPSYSKHDEHYKPLPEGQQREVAIPGYVRVSEVIEVCFEAIANDEIVAKAVESLNEQERKTIDELNQKLAAIREKRSQLLALTHQTEPA